VIADLRYGTKTVALNLFLPPDDGVGVLPIEYNGGPLSKDAFRLITLTKWDHEDYLEGFIVRHNPALTAGELAALEKLVGDPSELHLGDFMWAAESFCVGVAFAATAALAFMTYTAACPVLEAMHIPDSRIKEIGPQATAKELLAIRRFCLTGGA
jgi:hypothetical protein